MATPSKETFGNLLRKNRIEQGKSMGDVARHLGISVVYYSEVEGGRKKPFPEGKVNLASLAQYLEIDLENLQSLAEAQRREVRLNLFNTNREAASLALQFARRLSDDDLTQDEIKAIQQVLERGEKCTTE